MRRIRNRSRLDTLVNQKRIGSPVAWGKRIYLALVTVLGLLVLNYAVGDAIILRADGTVLKDRYIVAATYPAKVLRVNVREGQEVQAGQELVELESSEMLNEISELSIRASELSIREAQLRNRRNTVTSLLPLAERHASESNTQISRLDAIKARGLVSAQNWFRKSAQDDKWNFCLTTAMIAVNRRDHEQTTPPEPLAGLQGEGGPGRDQGRPNDRPAGRAFRRPPQPDHGMEIAA